MKRFFIRTVGALVVIIGLIYLYLVLAVNDKIKVQEEIRKEQPDSIRINDSTYQFKKGVGNIDKQ